MFFDSLQHFQLRLFTVYVGLIREKQLEREKEWNSKQILLLTEELDKKNAEIISNQREFSIKHLQLQTDISEKNEQVKSHAIICLFLDLFHKYCKF